MTPLDNMGLLAVVYALVELIKWILKHRNREQDKNQLHDEIILMKQKIVEIYDEQHRDRGQQLKHLRVLDRIAQTLDGVSRTLERLIDKIDKSQ